MNQTSEALATLIHYNVQVRDTLEYCLNKPSFEVALFKEKQRSIIVELEQNTPLKSVIDHSGDQGKKLEKMIHDFFDEVYGNDSTILKLAADGLRVDHNQHMAIYNHVIPVHEQVNAIIIGLINDAHNKKIDISDIEPVWRADERMYQGVACLCLSNDLIAKFNEFNKAMSENKGVPNAATNFISKEISELIAHFNSVKAHNTVTEVDYKENVEDKLNAFIENISGKRKLHEGDNFGTVITALQNAIASYLQPVETHFREVYVPAINALVAQAKKEAAERAGKSTAVPAADAPKAEAPKAPGEGEDVPLDIK